MHTAVCTNPDAGAPVDPAGEHGAASFWRSALKPFQILPVVESGAADAFGFGPAELAVASGSHGGRSEHVQTVERMLTALGVSADDLYCGPHPPYDEDAATALACAGHAPTRVHNNCSGKHTAMLALAAHGGWDVEGYWRLAHPVQRAIRRRLADFLDLDPDELRWEVDGCGLPTPFLSLREMAVAYARLGRAAAAGDEGPARVVAAMTGRPDLTSSPGREPLVLMRAGTGRLLAKEGAEGVMCVTAPDEGWGVALKIADGARRAIGPATVAVLDQAGLLTEDERASLAPLAEPAIRSTRGDEIGQLRAARASRQEPLGPS